VEAGIVEGEISDANVGSLTPAVEGETTKDGSNSLVRGL